MPSEVIDTNVLRVASVLHSAAPIKTPVTDTAVLRRVFEWVKALREDRDRHLVMDLPGQTIRQEYNRHLPKESYGRRVLIEKFSTGSMHFVQLTYWHNGAELVADLPETRLEKNFHDLGDRKMVAAAYAASAPIVNATDGDWTEPLVRAGLEELGIEVIQLLSKQERDAIRSRS